MKRRHFLGYSLLFIAGCSTATPTRNNPLKRGKPELLRFTVTDVQGIEALTEDYGTFRQALEEVLQTKIDFFPVESYTAAAVALQSNQVDLLLTGPSEYVVIHARTDAVPLIGIARQDYYSIIVVPENSEIRSLNQLQGKTISLKKPGSTSGHLGPTKLLLDAGLKPNENYQVRMLGSSEGMQALAEGQVDAWGGSKTDYESYKVSGKRFREIEKSSPLPDDLFVVSDLLTGEVVTDYKKQIIENQDKLIQALVRGEETQKYKGSRFVPVTDADYDVIRDVYEAIGEGDLIR